MINVCNLFDNCPPLPPNIVIDLRTLTGKNVAIFQTGPLPQSNSVTWKRYAGTFVTPPDVTTLVLTMQDITHGGCGNDFALDDITVRECVKTTAVTKTGTKPVRKSTKKRAGTVAEPAGNKIVKPQAVKKDSAVVINKKIGTDTPGIALEKIKEKPAAIPLPQSAVNKSKSPDQTNRSTSRRNYY